MTATICDPAQLTSQQYELIRVAKHNRGQLTVAVRSDTHGLAVRGRMAGRDVRFFDPQDPSVAEQHLSALRELVDHLLLSQRSRDVYELTNLGWHLSRKIH